MEERKTISCHMNLKATPMSKIRVRDFKQEYERRIRNGVARGLSVAAAGGHKNKKRKPVKEAVILTEPEPKPELEPIKRRSRSEVLRFVALNPCIGCLLCENSLSCTQLNEYIAQNVD